MDLAYNSIEKREISQEWRGRLDSFLLSYSQIFFSKDRWVGAVMLAATAVHRDLFLCGIIAVLLANGFATVVHLSTDAVKDGMFGYNALLIGLALSAFFKVNTSLVIILVLAVIATTLVTAALHAALSYYFNLPVLTLPFLIVVYLILAASPTIHGIVPNTEWGAYTPFVFSMPDILAVYLKSLGAIFFSPNIISGSILFVALLLFSRIATLLSFVGFAIGVVLSRGVFNFPVEYLYLYIGFNFMLTAIAVGGIWFVPQKASFLFAGIAVLFCAIILAGVANLFSFFGLPVLIFPFNLTVMMLLYGMRQRSIDRHPKSVDFVSGTPESNLMYYTTRVARFGANFIYRFSLPFLGTWTCTQGQAGEFTHKGLWEHAFDFEVQDTSGRFYKNAGTEVSDYFCYRLPILACCDGQVVKTVDNVVDNPVGKVNLRQNWGNVVVIQHGPALFSLVCHLAQGSLKVREGDIIKRGDILGLCGNSGRSAVPHVHFQLQSTARVGSPTIYSEFHELISEGKSPILHSTYVPQKGDLVRNVRRQEDIAGYFGFSIGQRMSFTCCYENKVWEEIVESEIDLYGNLKLVSITKRSVLYFENKNTVFVVYDFQGCKDSALFVLYTSAPRVPYESVENLTYVDVLSLRHFLSWGERILMDFAAPFSNNKGMKMRFCCERRDTDFIISGSSLRKTRTGSPYLETEAIFRGGVGWYGGDIIQNGKRFRIERTGIEELVNVR